MRKDGIKADNHQDLTKERRRQWKSENKGDSYTSGRSWNSVSCSGENEQSSRGQLTSKSDEQELVTVVVCLTDSDGLPIVLVSQAPNPHGQRVIRPRVYF